MKKWLTTLGVLAIIAALVGIGAYGIFTDTETSEENSLTAGTLDLKVGGQDDPNVAHMSFTDIKPGDSFSKNWKVMNDGSIDGHLTVKIENIVGDDNGCNEPETVAEEGEHGTATCGAGQGELGYFLRVKVCKAPNQNRLHNGPSNCSPAHVYHLGMPEGSFVGGIYRIDGKTLDIYDLPAGDWTDVKIELNLDQNVWRRTKGWPGVLDYDVDDNLLQSDSLAFDVVFNLDQK